MSPQPANTTKVDIPLSEVIFTTARSGGPGGQNVNKVETKVTLHFSVQDSRVLTDAQKADICARLIEAGDRRFDGWKIVITSQAHRTQGDNKRATLEKLNSLLGELTLPKIERIPTDAPEFVAKNRLRDKKIHSETKAQRRENHDRTE